MSRLYRYSNIFYSLGICRPSDFAEILWISFFSTLKQAKNFPAFRILVSQTFCVLGVLC